MCSCVISFGCLFLICNLVMKVVGWLSVVVLSMVIWCWIMFCLCRCLSWCWMVDGDRLMCLVSCLVVSVVFCCMRLSSRWLKWLRLVMFGIVVKWCEGVLFCWILLWGFF